MDLFKFNTEVSENATILEGGQEINDVKKIMWVERYAQPGEFSLESDLSSGLLDFLPLGTLISHVDTLEVMIVENHEIKETIDQDATIVITGRSFESYLENRIAGMNAAKGSGGIGTAIDKYILSANYSWNQIVTLINDHIVYTDSVDDSLTNIIAETSLTGTGESVQRDLQFGTVWGLVAELLKIDDLGIKTIRRNTFGVEGSSTETILLIHAGEDKSSSVFFSWKAGELASADYLFTQKNYKNTALVLGQYLTTVVETGPAKYDRRTMLVDAKDIDGDRGGTPIGGDFTNVIDALNIRGLQALANQNQVTISQADISKTTKYLYRRDYNIGDLVTLDGNFSQMSIMRVTEYAEIEDENGESGHPTLALPGG